MFWLKNCSHSLKQLKEKLKETVSESSEEKQEILPSFNGTLFVGINNCSFGESNKMFWVSKTKIYSKEACSCSIISSIVMHSQLNSLNGMKTDVSEKSRFHIFFISVENGCCFCFFNRIGDF